MAVKKINQWTRYLTVIVTAFQAGAYVAYLNSPGYAEAIIPAYSPYFWFSTVITLTAGTMFVMWLGEKIQDKGLGNGTSSHYHGGYPGSFTTISYSGVQCQR